MNPKFKKLASDTMIFAIGNILVKVIQFFLLPLYTSVMTTEQYGTAELINNLSELFYPIFCLCIYESLFRLAMDQEVDKKELFTSGIAVIGFTLPIAAILMFISHCFTGFQYTISLFALLTVVSIKTLFAQFARGIGCLKEFAISGVINVLFLLIFNIYLIVYLKLGVSAYLISLILSNIITIIYLFFYCKLYQYFVSSINTSLLKKMLFYCIPLIPNTFTWWFINIFDRYVILFSCGAELAGVFIAACKLPAVVNLCSTVFQQAWQISSVKELRCSNNVAFFSKVFLFYSASVITICSLLIVLSEQLAWLLLKGDFFIGWRYLPILMLSAMFNSYAIYFGTMYNATKKTVRILFSTILGTVLNVMLVFSLVRYIGVFAAPIAMLSGYAVISIFRAIDTQKYMHIIFNWKYHTMAFCIIAIQTVLISLNYKYSIKISFLLWFLLIILDMYIYKNQKEIII